MTQTRDYSEEIQAGNADARRNGEFKYWTRAQVNERLRDAPMRYVEHPPSYLMGAYKTVQIKYRGKWYQLGKTTVFDDIRTGQCYSMACRKPARILAAYFGARVTKESIFLINNYTDG